MIAVDAIALSFSLDQERQGGTCQKTTRRLVMDFWEEYAMIHIIPAVSEETASRTVCL